MVLPCRKQKALSVNRGNFQEICRHLLPNKNQTAPETAVGIKFCEAIGLRLSEVDPAHVELRVDRDLKRKIIK